MRCAGVFTTLAAWLFAGAVYGQAPALLDVGNQFHIATTNERTTLNRTTGELISTVDVTLFNVGGRELTGALHAVVFLSTGGVVVAGAVGGPQLPPYGAYYRDLTPTLTGGRLVANEKRSFSLTFTRARGVDFSYEIVPYAGLREENAPRLIVPPGPFSVAEGGTLAVPVLAEDDDGDSVVISSSPGVSNVTLSVTNGNPASGHLLLRPAPGQAGDYGVWVTATDPKGYGTSELIRVTVNKINRRPILYPPAPVDVLEGDFLSVPLETFDPDGDAVTVVGLDVPANAQVAGGAGVFYFSPDFDQAGIYTVRLYATDGDLSSATQALVVTVLDQPDVTVDTNRLTLVVDPQPTPTLGNRQRITGFVNVGTTMPPARATSALITGLTPANGRLGSRLSVTMTGASSGMFATAFSHGDSRPDFGPGIAVQQTTVHAPTSLTAEIVIGTNAAVGPRPVVVRTGEETAFSLLGFTVERAAASLSGNLVNAFTTNPIPGAIITIEGTSYTTISALDGSFVFPSVPPGTYRLIVNPPNHEPFVFTFVAEEGRNVELGELPTRPTVADPTAPASVSLMSVIQRAGRVDRGGQSLDRIEAMIRDALLLVGGTEAGVLDAEGRQLNPNVDGAGLISLTPDGVRKIAQKLDRGAESLSLGDVVFGLSFGFIWPGGGPPPLEEWLGSLQAAVNAAWSSPNEPENQLLILVFNNGPVLSPRPPVLSAATRLNPLQAFLFTSSFLAYLVDRDVNGNAMLLPPRARGGDVAMARSMWDRVTGALLPAAAFAQAPPSTGRLYTGYWRGFASARSNFASTQLSGAFTDFVALQMLTTLSSSSIVGLPVAMELAGQVNDQLLAYTAFTAQAARIPEPPRIAESRVVTNEGGGVSVELRFKPSFSHRQLQSRQFIYSLYRFRTPNDPRELVGFVVMNGTDLIPVMTPFGASSVAVADMSPRAFADLDLILRDDEPLPWVTDTLGQPALAPKATWFYAITATRLTRPDQEIEAAFLARTVSWWTQPLSGRAEGLAAYASRNWQALVSDYSNPAVVTVTPHGSPEAEQIEVDPTSGWVYYFNPTNQNVYLVPPVDLASSVANVAVFANAGFRFPPGGKGLAVDEQGNIFIGNAASEAQFGGRIFRYDKFGAARSHVGSLNYFSQLLMFANPTAIGPMAMGPGWYPANSPQDLYVVDDLAEVVKKVPVQATYDPNRRIGQPWAPIPFSARSMDLETQPSGDAFLLVERLASASLSGRLEVDDALLLVDDEARFRLRIENVGQSPVFSVGPIPFSILGDGVIVQLSGLITNRYDLNPGESVTFTSVYLAVSSGAVRVRGLAEGTDSGGTTVSSLPAPANGLPITIADVLEIIKIIVEPAAELRPGQTSVVQVILKNNSPLELENVSPTLTILTNYIGPALVEGSMAVLQALTPAPTTLDPFEQKIFTARLRAEDIGYVALRAEASGYVASRAKTYEAQPRVALVAITPFDFSASVNPSFVPPVATAEAFATITVVNRTSASYVNVRPIIRRENGVGSFSIDPVVPIAVGPNSTNTFVVRLSNPQGEGVVTYRVDLDGEVSGGGEFPEMSAYFDINIGPVFLGRIADVQLMLRTSREQDFETEIRMNRALPGVTVTMRDATGESTNLYSAVGNANGDFQLPLPKPGLYTMMVVHTNSGCGFTYPAVTADYHRASSQFDLPVGIVQEAVRLSSELTNITYRLNEIEFLFALATVNNTNTWTYQMEPINDFINRFRRGAESPRFRGIYPGKDFYEQFTDPAVQRVLGARLPDEWDGLQRLIMTMAFVRKRAHDAAFFAYVEGEFLTARVVQKLTFGRVKKNKAAMKTAQPSNAAQAKPLTTKEKIQLKKEDVLQKAEKKSVDRLEKAEKQKFGDKVKENGDEISRIEDFLFGKDPFNPGKEKEYIRRMVDEMRYPNVLKIISGKQLTSRERADMEIILRRIIAIRREVFASLANGGNPASVVFDQTLIPLVEWLKKNAQFLAMELNIVLNQPVLDQALYDAQDPQRSVKGATRHALSVLTAYDIRVRGYDENRRYYYSYILPSIVPPSSQKSTFQQIGDMVTYLKKQQPASIQQMQDFGLDIASTVIDEFMTPVQIAALVSVAVDLYLFQVAQSARAEAIAFSGEESRFGLNNLAIAPTNFDDVITEGLEDVTLYIQMFGVETILSMMNQFTYDSIKGLPGVAP